MPDRLTPEQISQRVAKLIEVLQKKLQKIDDAHETQRAAAIAESGLPLEWFEATVEDEGLSRPSESATIRNMPQVHSATASKKPAKRRKNGRESAVYLDPEKLARDLGFADLNELAKELGQTPATARSWRSRGYMPPRLHPQIEALKLLRATRKQ